MSTMRPRDRHAVPAPSHLDPETAARPRIAGRDENGRSAHTSGRAIAATRAQASRQARQKSFARRWRAWVRYGRARRAAAQECDFER